MNQCRARIDEHALTFVQFLLSQVQKDLVDDESLEIDLVLTLMLVESESLHFCERMVL